MRDDFYEIAIGIAMGLAWTMAAVIFVAATLYWLKGVA